LIEQLVNVGCHNRYGCVNIIKFVDPRVMKLQNVIVILLACISTIIGMITMVSASTYISTIPPGACNPTCNRMDNSVIKLLVDWK